MSYLRAFIPWIAFAVIPSSQWQWAALFAVALSVLGIARQTRSGLPLDAQIIEMGSGVYFVALAALAFADPHTGLHSYTAALASGALFLISGLSLLLRKPFTLGVAKQTISREFWDDPRFYRVNVVITAAWTAAFAVSGVGLVLLAHSSAMDRSVVQVAGFVVPMAFTARYTARVRARARAAEAQQPIPVA